jgi:branched-chain amino acid transport system substrate-binding protein
VGFIGGLSDRGSDVGEGGRNGLMLAIEQRNAAGGILGRPIELLVQDDGQNSVQAMEAARALVDANVDVVVGPFTSAMTAAVLPQMNQARVVMPPR